jgi:hypothetical protein
MDQELLKAVATYASVVAVVISLVNLTSQVRRHTSSLRSQNYAKALDRIAAVQSRLGTDPVASGIFSRGVRDAGSLDPAERIQMTWILYEIFGGFEFMFEEARRGTIPAQVWDRWAATLAWWISLPGVRTWWRSRPAPFTTGFSDFVDMRIERPAHDAAAAARWQSFLQEGKA